MNKITPRVICDCCGKYVYQKALHIENIQNYDTSSKESYVDSLMRLEGVAMEVALCWAEHGLFERCRRGIRNCPVCENELKTWRAKQCLKCGADFEPWMKVENI